MVSTHLDALGIFLSPHPWPASLPVSASCVPGRLSLASRLPPSGPSLCHGCWPCPELQLHCAAPSPSLSPVASLHLSSAPAPASRALGPVAVELEPFGAFLKLRFPSRDGRGLIPQGLQDLQSSEALVVSTLSSPPSPSAPMPCRVLSRLPCTSSFILYSLHVGIITYRMFYTLLILSLQRLLRI